MLHGRTRVERYERSVMSEALAFLSIGEVLALIKKDFPDVSISKIRYLESQGLIDPERTPSGYRKFYPYDIERLKKVLHLQRDSFLPLKVIKDTLDGRLVETQELVTQPTLEFPDHTDTPEANSQVDLRPDDEQSQLVDLVSRLAQRDNAELEKSRLTNIKKESGSSETESSQFNVRQDKPVEKAHTPKVDETDSKVERQDPLKTAAIQKRDYDTSSSSTNLSKGSPNDKEPFGIVRDELLSVEELSRLTGARVSEISEIESFGLIESKVIAGERYYGKLDFEIVQLVMVFKKYGVTSRHLRMYKLSAEREVGFIEQVITPLLRQRNPQARHKALEQVSDLRTLGSCLRGYFMERLLDKYSHL